ncbi:hypothetical protein SCAR479_12140 [Seiridium cardinale]|uniref:Geranylgeranyl pyrophosphate synthetase n=1 Tax=Seiridium cardinale TaxID=138064 RepID=A0ABR2XBH3_9PEZI
MYRGQGYGSHRGGRENVSTRSSWRYANQRQGHYPYGGWQNNGEPRSLPTVNEAPLGPVITEIQIGDIKNPTAPVSEAKISDLEYVASYSLVGVDSESQRIIVPGTPALWTPPALPIQVRGDRGEFLRDQNGARFPEHPMLPTVRSIFAMNESFESSNIDVVGCASSLGNLLRAARSVDSTFRFDVDFVGNTLFITRNAKDEKIQNIRGYGHSFLDAFTTHAPNLNETNSHQRIVKYRFQGLNYVVRFESDSYDGSLGKGKDDSVLPQEKRFVPDSGNSTDVLDVEFSGSVVPQEALLEIKTQAQYRGTIDLTEHIPRLWIRQVPNLVAGYHERGVFVKVKITNMNDEILQWEKNNQSDLRRFAATVNWLVTEVKRANCSSLEVYRQGTGPVQLREQIGTLRRALPESWSNIWSGLDLHHSKEEESSDSDDDDQGYPTISELRASISATLDYTECDLDCGYCGRCAF